jgi:hypothetical protein
LNEK